MTPPPSCISCAHCTVKPRQKGRADYKCGKFMDGDAPGCCYAARDADGRCGREGRGFEQRTAGVKPVVSRVPDRSVFAG